MMGWVDKNVFFSGPDGHDSELRCPCDHVPLPLYGGHACDGGLRPRDRLRLRHRLRGFPNKQPLGRFQDLQGSILPPNPPAKDFWALTMYDNQTRSQLQTSPEVPDRRQPDRGHQAERGRLLRHLLRPRGAPQGYENNWLATVPGKGWFVASPDVRTARAVDREDLASQ